MSATVTRRRRTEFAADPERHRLAFGPGIGLPALTVKDWTACPLRILARSHWTGPTTCRCTEEDASQ